MKCCMTKIFYFIFLNNTIFQQGSALLSLACLARPGLEWPGVAWYGLASLTLDLFSHLVSKADLPPQHCDSNR